MRKAIAFVMICTFLITCLFSVTANAADELRFFFWGTQSRLDGVQAAIKAFHKKYPQIKVQVSAEMVDWGNYFQKMPVLLASGELADISLVEGNVYSQFFAPMTNPPILDLAPYMKRDNFDTGGFDTRNWPLLTNKGRIQGVPWATAIEATEVMGFNMRMFDDVGLAYPDEKWTWQGDFIPASRKLTIMNPDGSVKRYASNFVATHRPFWQQVLYTYGGRIFNADGTEVALNEPRAYAALQMMRDLRANGLAVWGSALDHMPKGNIAMGFEYWTLQNTILGQMKDPYGVTVFPQGPAGHGIFRGPKTGPAHSLVVSQKTRFPQEAWAFVKFMTTEPEAIRAWAGGQERPPLPYKPLVKTWGELLSPLERERWLPTAALWDALAVSVDKPVDPFIADYRQIDAIFASEFESFLGGSVPVETAVAKAKSRIDPLLRAAAGK